MILCPTCEIPVERDNQGWFCRKCGQKFKEYQGITQFINNEKPVECYYPEDAFEILDKTEEANFWFRVRNKIIRDTIRRFLPSSSRILEVGCGTGFVSRYLKDCGYRIECADLFFEALKFCKKRDSGERYYQYNLSDKIFVDEFDGVCAFDVIEHIDNDRLIIKNLYAALKPGGFLFITVPADKRLWSSWDIYSEHKRRYTAEELERKIKDNGFRIIRMSYFMTILFPIILISRKLSFKHNPVNTQDYQKGVKNKVMSELQPNRVLNALFFLIFSLEVPIVRHYNFPFGSSLLCVAVKEVS